MTQPTAGPWEVWGHGVKTINGHPDMDESELWPVAQLGPGSNEKANGRLIAAAPAMLEALKVLTTPRHVGDFCPWCGRGGWNTPDAAHEQACPFLPALDLIAQALGNITVATETPTEWMLRHIEAFAASYPDWRLDTPEARLRLAQHLGGNWEMVQQARAARPPAILPDVRDVVTSYEERITSLRARVGNFADLLQHEIDVVADALEEMRYILREIRKETA